MSVSVVVNGFITEIWKKVKSRLFPEQEPIYNPEILEAADIAGVDPSQIIWCDTCREYHEDFYGS